MLSSATPYLHLHNFHLHVSFFFFCNEKKQKFINMCTVHTHWNTQGRGTQKGV